MRILITLSKEEINTLGQIKEIRDESDIVFCLHELVKRFTPKKPVYPYVNSLPACPNCGEVNLRKENEYGNPVANYDFCPDCGKAIFWEGENE